MTSESKNDDIGKIPSVSDNPKRARKDRGDISVRGREKKKIDFSLIAIIAFTILVPVGLGLYFFGSSESEVITVDAKPEHSSTEAFVMNSDDKPSFTLVNLMKSIEDKKEAQEKRIEEEEKINSLPEPIITTTEQRNVFKPETLHETVVITKENKVKSEPLSSSERRKLGGGVMAYVDGNEETKNGSSSVPSIAGSAISGIGGGLEQFSNTFDSPKYKDGKASLTSVTKQDFLLRSGTNIPCALITKVVSTYAGLVSCSVISDVYSANGTTLLIEKGSTISGNQSVSLAQGQARLFVTWANVKTPEGVNVQIDSLGTDALGASGIEAHVDNHFNERFGGAIMLSFIDDAFATMSNKIAKNNSDITTDSTSDAAKDIAGIALENSINIPPTGYVNIGERVNILVARDIDMSNVYKIKPY